MGCAAPGCALCAVGRVAVVAALSEWKPQDAEYSLLAFSDLSKSNFLVALFSFERWTYFIVEGFMIMVDVEKKGLQACHDVLKG